MNVLRQSRTDLQPRLVAIVALLALWGFEAVIAVTMGGDVVVANAVVLDVTLCGTLLFWWLGVRRGGLPPVVLAPVFLAGLALGNVLVGSHDPIALNALEAGAIAVELGLIVVIVRRVGSTIRRLGSAAGDPHELIREAVAHRLGSGWAGRVVASELAALWFATFGWVHSVPGYGRARVFTCGRHAGAIYAALLGLSAVEIPLVHLLVSRWSTVVAWVLTALAVYGAIWILGDLRALRLRPVTLDDEELVVRTGLRWTAVIPRSRMTAAVSPDWRESFGSGADQLNLAVTGSPNVVVEVDGPVVASGPFGITRSAPSVGLSVDDPAALIDALA